jgi:predicted metallo-beta-lactamase superfamily hydrolase
MKTTTEFRSYQYNVTDKEIEKHFKGLKANSIILEHIEVRMQGYGHWMFKAIWNIDGKEQTIKRVTNSAPFYDEYNNLLEANRRERKDTITALLNLIEPEF